MRWDDALLCGTLAVAGCGRLGFGTSADDNTTGDLATTDAAVGTDAACGGDCAATTYQWSPRAPGESPGRRSRHAMVYDAGRQHVLLFGGTSDTANYANDLWSWDGSTWTAITPSSTPPGRIDPALTYDAARDVVVLFGGVGGLDGNQIFGDTWVWDGTAWTDVTTATSPIPRYSPTLAYDEVRQTTLLYGGCSGEYATAAYAETWGWDGTTWTLRANAGASPPPRERHALVFDRRLGQVITYGGVGADGFAQADSWTWDGAAWTAQLADTALTARHSYALVYASLHQRTLLFGGLDGVEFQASTWAWDGVTWIEALAGGGPTAREQTALAFDEARGEVVMYGGHSGPSESDTWVLTP